MSDSGVASLFRIDTHPAYGGTALFHRPALVESNNFDKNRCEIPLASGALEHDLGF
jgi:hypothetical protein